MKPEELTSIARQIADETIRRINKLNLPTLEFRRDFDGVKGAQYMLLHLIADILVEGRPNIKGLIACDNENSEGDE